MPLFRRYIHKISSSVFAHPPTITSRPIPKLLQGRPVTSEIPFRPEPPPLMKMILGRPIVSPSSIWHKGVVPPGYKRIPGTPDPDRAYIPEQAPGALSAPQPERRITSLPSGDAGTAKTVGFMRKMIHQGSKSSSIRELAANLVMHQSTDQGKIGSIFEFVRNKMKYVRDPLHQELLAGADYHMDTMSTQGYARGDCDDHTIMLGAMLESVGYPTRIATARMKPGGSGSFDHVYLEVNDRTGWIPLDASNKKREAGEAPPSNRLRRW